MGPDAMIFIFWMLSYKPTFLLSSFTFIKRLFSSSSLSAIKVVSSAYLRLLIFLPAILIPACVSSSPVFLMMHSAYKLNKQGDNIQPWRTPFPIWNQSVVPCPVLTVASWPACRFLKRQVRWSVLGVHWKDWCWSWNSNTLATWCKELKRPWCWERLRAGGEGDDRGWDGWMASLTQWTRIWVDSGRWWRTGRPGVLQFMGLQRVGHSWATELNWTELIHWSWILCWL